MEKPGARSRLSRRGLIRTSAAGAVAVGVGLPATVRADVPTSVAVAATVARASHSKSTAGTIRLGVRTSVQPNGEIEDGRVLILDGIDFFASQDGIRQSITTQVRDDIVKRFQQRGMAVKAADITVRVFGGLW